MMKRALSWLGLFESAVVTVLMGLLCVIVVLAIVDLSWLLIARAPDRIRNISDTGDFQTALRNAFGGVLSVVIGLELLETLKVYFREHTLKLEVIIFVALIATGRHLVQLEVHGEPLQLVGLAALVLALAGSYYLLRRANALGAHG